MAKKAARKRKPVDPWATPQRDEAIDVMFQAQRAAAMHSLKRTDIVVASDADELTVGLPLPSLAIRYLFQSDVFPLSRVVQLAGVEGSGKTALLYEFMRWHMTYGGGGFLAECENKDASKMRSAVLNYNPRHMSRLTWAPASSLEQWQGLLTTHMHLFRKAMDAVPGPGRTIPICLGIDSLTALDTEGEIAKTAEAGFAKLGFAHIANLINRYMKQAIVGNLRGYPLTIVGTNHLKPAKDPITGVTLHNVPGGKAVPFMATYMVETKLVKDVDTSDYEGIRIEMLTRKCGMGTSRKRIQVELLWWQEPDPEREGKFRQRMVWDWDTATIDLFIALCDSKNKKTLYKNLMDVCDIRESRSTKTCWSKTLGIQEDQKVPYRVAAQMLEARSDLLEIMYPMLGINRYYGFQPGLDYMRMLAEAAEVGAKATQSLYEQPEDLPELSGTSLDPADQVGDDAEAATEPLMEQQA